MFIIMNYTLWEPKGGEIEINDVTDNLKSRYSRKCLILEWRAV